MTPLSILPRVFFFRNSLEINTENASGFLHGLSKDFSQNFFRNWYWNSCKDLSWISVRNLSRNYNSYAFGIPWSILCKSFSKISFQNSPTGSYKNSYKIPSGILPWLSSGIIKRISLSGFSKINPGIFSRVSPLILFKFLLIFFQDFSDFFHWLLQHCSRGYTRKLSINSFYPEFSHGLVPVFFYFWSPFGVP